jgi:hypothetical protein
MKKLAIGLVLAALVVAIAAFVADRYAQAWAAQRIDAILAAGKDVTGTHGAVAYSLWRRSIEIDDVALQFPAAPDKSIHAGTLTIAGIGPFGSPGVDTGDTVTADLHLTQLSVETEARATTVGSLDIRGFHMPAALLGHSLATVDDWKAFLAATTIEHLDLHDVAATLADGRAAIGRITVEQMKPGAIDKLSLTQVLVVTPERSARAATGEIHGIAYGFGDATTAPHFFVASLRLADLAGGSKGDETTVAEVRITMVGTPEKPDGGTFAAKTVDLPAAAYPVLAAMGYDRVRLDLTSKLAYDVKGGTVDNQVAVSAPDAGNLAFSFRLSNYHEDGSSPDVNGLVGRLREARLDRFELHYDDASLVDRLIGVYALNAGTDVTALRARLVAPLEAQRAGFADKPALAADVDAVIAFLREPGSLTVAATPPKPLVVGDILSTPNDPEGTAARLGLVIKDGPAKPAPGKPSMGKPTPPAK